MGYLNYAYLQLQMEIRRARQLKRPSNRASIFLLALIGAIFLIYSSTSDSNSYSTSRPTKNDPTTGFQSFFSSNSQSDVLSYILQSKEHAKTKHQVIKGKRRELDLLDFDRKGVKYIYPEVLNTTYLHTNADAINWSKYAYVLQATSSDYLCNAIMILSQLRSFNTRALLVLLTNEDFLNKPNIYPKENEILNIFAKKVQVVVKPIKNLNTELNLNNNDENWVENLNKYLVFGETEYDRVIYLDSDSALPRGNLDELFFLPPCKLAAPNAYWLTDANLNKLGINKLKQKYGYRSPIDYSLTHRQRLYKLKRFINENIEVFFNANDKDFLPIIGNSLVPGTEKEADKVNEKNFYTSLYNQLPELLNPDEFVLNSNLMVIQPSKINFETVLSTIKEQVKSGPDFDSNVILNELFNVTKIPIIQDENSMEKNSKLTYADRFQEIPELLIIPSKVYGALTNEMNLEVEHSAFMVDAHEQIFQKLSVRTSNDEPSYYDIEWRQFPGDFFYENVKYVHFSDSPIPKPWFKQDSRQDYMRNRARCHEHPDFKSDDTELAKPKLATGDCSNAKNWEFLYYEFELNRKAICNLDLLDAPKEVY